MSEKLKDLLSFGNSKVGNDTAIFNMNPAFSCPSEKLNLCEHAKYCYAKKAERIYPQTLPYRERQETYWDSIDVKTFVEEFTTAIKKKKTTIKYLRFSESGDFKSQADVDKLSAIAEELKDIVVVYTYTARKDLDYTNISENLVVNGSGFMVSNNFYIINKKGDETAKSLVCNGSCIECRLCKMAKGRNIAVIKH